MIITTSIMTMIITNIMMISKMMVQMATAGGSVAASWGARGEGSRQGAVEGTLGKVKVMLNCSCRGNGGGWQWWWKWWRWLLWLLSQDIFYDNIRARPSGSSDSMWWWLYKLPEMRGGRRSMWQCMRRTRGKGSTFLRWQWWRLRWRWGCRWWNADDVNDMNYWWWFHPEEGGWAQWGDAAPSGRPKIWIPWLVAF